MTTSSRLGSVEIIGAAWNAIAEEMGRALVRTAISPNVKERRDCSTAIFSARGELLAQASHIPVHLGSLMDFARHVAEDSSLEGGDVFCCNDPYAYGGAHLNDIAVVSGVFLRGRLLGIVGTIAHHSDVGGRVPGSESADSTEIFQDGMRIPPVRLCRSWEPLHDIWKLITANSRLSSVLEADLRSQIAACRVGIAREIELVERYGEATLERVAAEWLEYAERRFRSACKGLGPLELPISAELDDDGRGGAGARIRGSIAVRDGLVQVDLRNCSGQVRGAMNAPLAATKASIFYALKSVMDPDCPSSEGYFRVIEIATSSGSIVDPVPPAATGHRIAVCQKLADAVVRAFAESGAQHATAGSHGSSLVILSGEAQGRPFVNYESFAGGLGGCALGPGAAGMMALTTNSSNLPIEVMEREYPFLVKSSRLRPGSGGDGQHRGGDGVVREMEVLSEPVVLTTGIMDARVPPKGVCGGGDGLPASCRVRRVDDADWAEIPAHVSGFVLHKGDELQIESAGGGGWGKPLPDNGGDTESRA